MMKKADEIEIEILLKNIQNNFDIFKISCIFVYRISSSANPDFLIILNFQNGLNL